ncbi:MAG: hypothetical protein ABFC63_02580 [Thermoguttaceae bacterium]
MSTRIVPIGMFLIASALSHGQAAEWQRDPTPLVKNFNNMYQPCVVEVGGEWRYRMWFFGWAADYSNTKMPGCDAIFLARSKDLRRWEVYAGEQSGQRRWDTTMNPRLWVGVVVAGDRWYDCWHNGDPSVVLRDGRYYMAYSATSNPHMPMVPGYPGQMVQCIMGATSDDGIHWRKTSAPLLIRAGDRKNPKPEPERIGDFHRPCLRWEGGRWRLWFDYWIPAKGCCLGYAEQSGEFTDPAGFHVQHDVRAPLLEEWPNPEVVKIGSTYHLFGDPPGYRTDPAAPKAMTGWTRRQLREAVSSDGIHWQRLPFIAPDPDTDACHVPQALVTETEGRKWLYLFYSTQVGHSRHDGKYYHEYDRIRAMRRPLE